MIRLSYYSDMSLMGWNDRKKINASVPLALNATVRKLCPWLMSHSRGQTSIILLNSTSAGMNGTSELNTAGDFISVNETWRSFFSADFPVSCQFAILLCHRNTWHRILRFRNCRLITVGLYDWRSRELISFHPRNSTS